MRLKNYWLLISGLLLLLAACHKVEDLPYHDKGTPVTLTASQASLTPTPADSATAVLTVNCTFPDYATDSANMKYVVEIDSTGKNFAKGNTKTVLKNLSASYTGRELNTMLLNYGYSLGTPVKLDIRVTSSYANNNEKLVSNVVQLTITPYSDPSKLTTENTAVTGAASTSTNHSNTFSWLNLFLPHTSC